MSKTFRKQAERLRAAAKQSTLGTHIFQLLKENPPEKWQTLNRKIVSESEVQHMRLKNLTGVLYPDVLAEKLALLPEL